MVLKKNTFFLLGVAHRQAEYQVKYSSFPPVLEDEEYVSDMFLTNKVELGEMETFTSGGAVCTEREKARHDKFKFSFLGDIWGRLFSFHFVTLRNVTSY